MKKIILLLILTFSQTFIFGQIKVDEYDRVGMINDDESARIWNLYGEIQNNPQSKGYIISHRSKNIPLGIFLRNVYGIENFWANFFKLNPKLLVSAIGEDKEEGFIKELWIIPEGKETNFKTISLEDKLKEKITEKTLFDETCLDCDSDPPIPLKLLKDGLKFYIEALKANPETKGLIIIRQPSVVGLKKTESLRNVNRYVAEFRKKLTEEFNTYKQHITIIVSKSLNENPIITAELFIIPKVIKNKK